MDDKWITCKKLLERWKIEDRDYEIFEYVKKGLQPYDNAMIAIPPPGVNDWKRNILIYKDEIHQLEEDYDGFTGHVISANEFCIRFPDRKPDKINPERIFFSDGSCSLYRKAYDWKKKEVERLENELNKYPDRPSWINYELPEGYRARRFVIKILLNAHYKSTDIFDIEKNIGSSQLFISKSNSKKSPSDLDKEKENAIGIAKKHIKDCKSKDETPVIADGVMLVKEHITKSRYKDRTIHDWIKPYYPSESRKPGRKPNWRNRVSKKK